MQELSSILSCLIIDLFEETIINKLIWSEYFYFDQLERKEIADITIDDLFDDEEALYSKPETFELLFNDFYEYLLSNHSIVLKGFITFRIKNYLEILSEQIDKSVNKFLVQREYTEFIALLKLYVNTEPSLADVVHLVYYDSKPILLDSNKKIIHTDENLFNAKYLSDISFSSSDYALNTLLSIIPKKIYIHLIDNTIDDFITTLKLVFENRVVYCTDCSICKMYKKVPLGSFGSFGDGS